MRYKPKSIAALQLALGGLPDQIRVEVDPEIEVSGKTVGELRKITARPGDLAITTPQDRLIIRSRRLVSPPKRGTLQYCNRRGLP